MDQEFRTKRHTELWIENNRRVKRVVWGGLAFAAFVLLNVLRPYAQNLDDSSVVRDELVQLEMRRQEIDLSLERLTDFEGKLSSAQATIAREPWMRQKDRLIEEYRQLNLAGGGSREDYQTRANRTVNEIAQEVEAEIEPLRDFLDANPSIATEMPRFSSELEQLPRTIDHWIEVNRDHEWYRTVTLKTETVQGLSDDLQRGLSRVDEAISQERPLLAARSDELNAEIGELNEQTSEQMAMLDELEEAMQTILPQWVRGLVTVEQMVELYPLIVLGLAVYLLATGLALTRHYDALARGHAWSPQERSDPAFSSLWTLTYRGRLGTASTVAVYLGALAALWFFFEAGAKVLADWRDAGNTGMLAMLGTNASYWLARILLVGTMAIALSWPHIQSRAWRSVT